MCDTPRHAWGYTAPPGAPSRPVVPGLSHFADGAGRNAVIVGRGRGGGITPFRPVADRLARRAGCPVVVVP